MSRHDGRAVDALRVVEMTPDYLSNPLASVLIKMGDTRVLCNASHDEKTPFFLKNSGMGWVTADAKLSAPIEVIFLVGTVGDLTSTVGGSPPRGGTATR